MIRTCEDTTTEGREIEFASEGITCRGLYFPARGDAFATSGGAPCVVLAHGLGGTVDAGLVPFAERFAAAGLHALAFDYRHFGRSDGEPRQLLDVEQQLDDWQAAIHFVRQLPGVDPDRIVLWGTSFSGGHVVSAAVRDGHIAAVIAQCPMFDGLSALRNMLDYAGFAQALRLTLVGVRDLVRGVLRLSPITMPVVGEPGTRAFITSADALASYLRIAPPDWRNEICARSSLILGSYRPGLQAGKLPCRILVQICDHDSLLPAAPALAAVRRAGRRAELVRYPIGHFDIYVGDAFEHAVSDEIDFLRRVLVPSDDL